MTNAPLPIRFAVIGINHGHIYGQIRHMLNAGGEFVAWYAEEPDLCAPFAERFPNVPQVDDERRILEDPTIQLVLSAGIPSDRAPLGIRVMEHGKDYMSDKPGMTSLAQLADVRRVQAVTGRIYSICYCEHYDVGCTVLAGELVQSGAIGRVVQTLGLGPHRANLPSRPDWFFRPEKYGGILTDIASHQVEQFLFFTNSTEAEVVSSSVANYRYPQHAEFEDFGEMTLRGNGGHGYIRVDWYTPDGLSTWGDGRLTILGTDGYIELRKYVDVTRSDGGNHLFLVDGTGEHYMDGSTTPLPYGKQLAYDILHRTETHCPQSRTFLAMELALQAQAQAQAQRPSLA